jgi:phosphatidate cytidylyltransferase
MIDSKILFCCAFLWLSLSAFWLHTLKDTPPDISIAVKIERLRIWLLLALGEILVVIIGYVPLAILAMALFAVAGCVEIAQISRAPAFTVTGVMLAVLCSWMPPLHIGLALATVSIAIFLLPFRARPTGRRAAALLLSFYVGLAPSVLIACRERPGLLLAVLLTLTTSHMIDIVSGFAGTRIGGHRPLSRLSPNKTLWGFAVGCTLAVLAGLALTVPFWSQMEGVGSTWLVGIGLGISLWVITVLGDLVGSKVKRMLQVKNYGTCLGPQGGFMDRLDAFVPAVIAGCIVVS